MGMIKAVNASIKATLPAISGEMRSRKKERINNPLMKGIAIQRIGALIIHSPILAEKYQLVRDTTRPGLIPD